MQPMSCDVYKSKLFNVTCRIFSWVLLGISLSKTEQRRNAIFKANPKGTSHFLLVFFALLVRQASLIFLVSLFVFFTIFQSPSLSLLVVFLSLSLHPSSTLLVAISYSLKPVGLDFSKSECFEYIFPACDLANTVRGATGRPSTTADV
ncbi:hypothetical protein BKA70DRAFT_405755 [Coprinopsis sp. MPI-PUGE-AT-0042]|nr:hypothetical protein BKA70DRAFT_405755 [Coprinopsis sp. MPI-PUGE-AT-0042]